MTTEQFAVLAAICLVAGVALAVRSHPTPTDQTDAAFLILTAIVLGIAAGAYGVFG